MKKPCCMWFVIGLLLASVGCAHAGVIDGEEQFLLGHDDLIVRGRIADIRCRTIERRQWVPGGLRPDWPFPVTIVSLAQLEVLRGHFDAERLDVVAGGGFPPGCSSDEPLRTITTVEGVTFNYSVGDEVVLCLWYSETVMGGSYLVSNDHGRYIRVGNVWVNQASSATRTIDEIISVTEVGTTKSLALSAELVLEGTVVGVSKEVGTVRADLGRVRMNIANVWKGVFDENEVGFRVVETPGGAFPWKAYVPDFKVGENWVVFLRKDANGFYAVGDRNGVLRVDNGSLLQAGKLRHVMKRSSLRDYVRGEVEQ